MRTCMTFLSLIVLRNKTVAHTFLPSFDNANSRLCQERFLRSSNIATMVTCIRPHGLLTTIDNYSSSPNRLEE